MEENFLSEKELKSLVKEASRVFPGRVEYYARKIGVSYNKISVKKQLTRWGSCSAEGNLNFNCLLLLAPPEVIDSVVVHELCHRKEMNHSENFYKLVLEYCPDYYKWDKWLKDHGEELMRRNPAYRR